jgi:hypothetical protein
MRNALFALAMVAALSMFVATASAQDVAEDASAGAAFANPVRIAGSLAGGGGSTVPGTCTIGFSNQCPIGHSCTCFTVMAAKFTSSKIGRGSANFYATIDHTAAFGTLGAECMPIYGEIDVIAKKDSPNFAVWGAACTDPQGNLAANGAMGLESSPKLFVASGYATFTATISKAGRVNLKFRGAAQ